MKKTACAMMVMLSLSSIFSLFFDETFENLLTGNTVIWGTKVVKGQKVVWGG